MTATAVKQTEELGAQATKCFERKEYEKAATLLGECLLQEQTSERWNDWATARFFSGRSAEAEAGYVRALQMDAGNAEASANMGTLLSSLGRVKEAIPYLEKAAELSNGNPKPALLQLLQSCRTTVLTAQDEDHARMVQMHSSLTRMLSQQSQTLDRALFRLATLPLEVHDGTARVLRALEELKGSGFSSGAGNDAAAQRRVPALPLDTLFADDLAVELRAPRAVDGNTSIFEVIVLNTLLRKSGAKHAFEIGTFDGRTTLNLAANLPADGRVFTLDLPREQIGNTQLKLGSGDHAYILKERSGERFQGADVSAKITQLYGDSARFDFSSFEGKMDFVFIDGSHTREYVLSDSRNALKLLRDGRGRILWHDYPSWQTVAAAIHELQEKEPAFRSIRHIPETNLAYLEVNGR